MAFYPNIKEDMIPVLSLVFQNLQKDPSYLNSPECPYSEKLKDVFRKFETTKSVDIFEGNDELLVMDQQIQKIINDLEGVASALGSADHQEKLNYFKTKTSLFEKLISMKERVYNLKELNEFRSIILAFLDEICTKDQITDLMKRLDGVFGSNE